MGLTSWLRGSSPVQLDLHVNERNIYLFPNGCDPATASGTVTLSVERPGVSLRALTVRCRGEADVRTPSRESHGTTLDLKVHLLDGPVELVAHKKASYGFVISIPATSPQTQAPRSYLGDGSSHTLRAEADVDGRVIQAIERISLTSILLRRNDPPHSLNLLVEDTHEALGAVRLHFQSCPFSIGGCIWTAVELHPTCDVVLLELGLLIEEGWRLRHFDKSGVLGVEEWKSSPARWNIFCVKDGVSKVDAGRPYAFQRLARLPGSHQIKYSTPESVLNTPFRTSHELVFTLLYRSVSREKDYKLEMRRAVFITACIATENNLYVPDYEEDHLDAAMLGKEVEPRDFSTPDWGVRPLEKCLCRATDEEVFAMHQTRAAASLPVKSSQDHDKCFVNSAGL